MFPWRTAILVFSVFSGLFTAPVRGGPFSSDAGSYGGLINPSAPDSSNTGTVTVVLSAGGSLSGKLVWQGGDYPFVRVFDSSNTVTKKFPKLDESGATLVLTLTLLRGTQEMNGSLEEKIQEVTTSQVSFTLSGEPPDPEVSPMLKAGTQTAFIDPPTRPAAAAGIAEAKGLSTVPQLSFGVAPGAAPPEIDSDIPGDGFSIVSVSPSFTATSKRNARFVGRLNDYQPYSSGSPLRGKKYSLYRKLYKDKDKNHLGRGQFFGEVEVRPNGFQPASVVSQFLRWGKKPINNDPYYPGGFENELFLDGVKYPRVSDGLPPIDIDGDDKINARIRFRRGNLLAMEFEEQILIKPTGVRVLGANPNQVSVQVFAAAAKFKGSFKHPISKQPTDFTGAFQAEFEGVPGEGRGSFLGANESGQVRIGVILEE